MEAARKALADKRLEQQIRFIIEIDKLKSISRRTYLIDSNRNENTAEHSWHLAMMAMLLAEYSNEPLDVSRVIKMVLIHDIVEIDAGDTFVYDSAAMAGKEERERVAADRLFGILPADQGGELRRLWDEFEARITPEARFAYALDRLAPQLHNYYTNGGSWKEHGISKDRVVARNADMSEGSASLWEWTKRLLEDAESKGFLGSGTL
jgi:putative hydrolase of HD superfamily